MLAFSIIIAFGAITVATAGLITPLPLVRAFATYSPIYSQPRAPGLVGPDRQYLPIVYDDGVYRPKSGPIPLAASPYGLVPAGSGLEGHYVPDNNEKLFDDGSYRPQASPISFRNSPYGLVPAGSGLEGQYVPNYSEKLYDDGSYRTEYF